MANKTERKSDGFIFKMIEAGVYISFVILGFYLAFLFRFNMQPEYYNIGPFYDNMPYIAIASIVVFYIYDIVTTSKKSLFENAVIIALCLVLINLITIAIMFFSRGFSFPRSVFFLSFIVQFILIFISKFFVLKTLKYHRKSEDILIIASEEQSQYLATKILQDKFNYDKVKHSSSKINKDTYRLIDKVDKIYIGSNIDNNDKTKIIRYCSGKGKTVYIVPGLLEISLVDFKTTQVSDVLLFRIDDIGLSYEQRLIKRIVDIVISLIGIIIVSPIILITSIIIKVYDRGPILFKQERVTKNNKTFKLYKFRTMIVDAEKKTGPVLATERDPRITPLGRFLRASRIDELPQLFNVLRGDMSIVGPRPERPFFVEQFNEEIDEFKYRVFVKAGITGLAQVLGTYATNAEDKARYDLLYIKNYSLLLDIKIMFNTVKIMFIKESSAGVVQDKKRGKILENLDIDDVDLNL